MIKNNSIKIGITGAQGVGKTTLSNKLKIELDKRNISSTIIETPRNICLLAGDNTFLRRGKNTSQKQSLILFAQMVNELKASFFDEAQVQICDRCIIDHWAYSIYFFKDAFNKDGIIELYEHFIIEHFKSYDFVYYHPAERTPLDDGIRENSLEFQSEIDKIIFNILNQHSLPYKKISGENSDTLSIILNDILPG